MTETKVQLLNTQSIDSPDGLAPLGPEMQNQGDPVEWRKYVNVLYEVIRENYDQSDQVVLALQGPLQNVEMEIDRLLALSKKWGDLLPFYTKERLMYLCNNRTALGSAHGRPDRAQLSGLKILINGDSSMKLKDWQEEQGRDHLEVPPGRVGRPRHAMACGWGKPPSWP